MNIVPLLCTKSLGTTQPGELIRFAVPGDAVLGVVVNRQVREDNAERAILLLEDHPSRNRIKGQSIKVSSHIFDDTVLSYGKGLVAVAQPTFSGILDSGSRRIGSLFVCGEVCAVTSSIEDAYGANDFLIDIRSWESVARSSLDKNASIIVPTWTLCLKVSRADENSLLAVCEFN